MTELNKNDVIECVADGLGMDGEGVAHPGGKTLFVRGVLPGERFRAKVIAVKPRFDVGLCEKIITPSPDRVAPACPLFGKCGGCDLMHLGYPAQLRFKRETVASALHKAGIDVYVREVVPSERALGYRNKASVPVRRGKDGETATGFFARGSHRVVPTDDCPLQAGKLGEFVAALKKFMAREGLVGYDEADLSGDIRELAVRFAGGKHYVTVVAARPVALNGFVREAREIDPAAEVWLNVNRSRGNAIFGDEWKFAGGDRDPAVIDGMRVDLHPAAFLQINDGVREKLYSAAAELVRGGAAVEAYSGAGLLSARLAEKAATVFGIEINAQAHAAALDLKARNGLNNFFPAHGDTAVVLPEILKKCAGAAGTFVVLDPPRAGLAPAVRSTLLSSGAENIVYISCDPATLARDLAELATAYDVASVTPFDMFPQTANVETLVVLSHKKPDGHIGVKVEFGEGEGQISLKEVERRAEERKPKEKVTYKMIQDYIEKTYGFKVHTAYIAEVKRSLGLPMYDAPNAVEELKRPRSHPSPQMVEAIKETLKHFEII